MSQSKNSSDGEGNALGGMTDGLRSIASKNPATGKLFKSLEGYLGAQSEKLLGSVSDKVGDTTKKLAEVASGKADPSGFLGNTTKKLAEGESPGKAALEGTVASVTNKVKGFFGKAKGPSSRKSINIEEQIDIGVPVRDAYDRWTQFAEFSKWAKGVQSVNQEDPVKSSWNAKIFLSKRNWNAKITDQIADERISWKSDGPKGTVDGVVTFHSLAPNLTRVLLALEYHPAGLFEKTGNVWRAQGRRARLDLKLYRRFVMTSTDEVEGWRGEIRDGEIVKDHDEAMAEEQEQQLDYDDYEGDDNESGDAEGDEYDEAEDGEAGDDEAGDEEYEAGGDDYDDDGSSDADDEEEPDEDRPLRPQRARRGQRRAS